MRTSGLGMKCKEEFTMLKGFKNFLMRGDVIVVAVGLVVALAFKPARRKSAMAAYAAQTGREQKPAQRRPRPRLNPNAWSHQPPNFPSLGSSGW